MFLLTYLTFCNEIIVNVILGCLLLLLKNYGEERKISFAPASQLAGCFFKKKERIVSYKSDT